MGQFASGHTHVFWCIVELDTIHGDIITHHNLLLVCSLPRLKRSHSLVVLLHSQSDLNTC